MIPTMKSSLEGIDAVMKLQLGKEGMNLIYIALGTDDSSPFEDLSIFHILYIYRRFDNSNFQVLFVESPSNFCAILKRVMFLIRS